MPIPALGVASTIRSDNPLCCIGCCSYGDLDISIERKEKDLSSDSSNQQNSNHYTSISKLASDLANNSSSDNVVTSQPKSSSERRLSVSSLMRIESTIENQIDNLAINILRSERSGRCCSVIYDTCSPRCTAPCKECGCGSCGRLLCGIFDSCCVVGAGGSILKLTGWHRDLRTRYDACVVGMAEQELGMSFQDMIIQGRSPTKLEKQKIEEACLRASALFSSLLGLLDKDSWKEDQDQCVYLLEDSEWVLAIEKAGGQLASNSLPNLDNVLIVSNTSRFDSCSKFNFSKVGKEISDIKVSTEIGVEGILGVSEATLITVILGEILANHPSNRGNFWITKQDLRALVCLILAIRKLSFVNTNGDKSTTSNLPNIKQLRKKFQKIKGNLMLSCSTLICIDVEDSKDGLGSSGLSFSEDILSDNVFSILQNKMEEIKDRLCLRQIIQEDSGRCAEGFRCTSPKKKESLKLGRENLSFEIKETSSSTDL